MPSCGAGHGWREWTGPVPGSRFGAGSSGWFEGPSRGGQLAGREVVRYLDRSAPRRQLHQVDRHPGSLPRLVGRLTAASRASDIRTAVRTGLRYPPRASGQTVWAGASTARGAGQVYHRAVPAGQAERARTTAGSAPCSPPRTSPPALPGAAASPAAPLPGPYDPASAITSLRHATMVVDRGSRTGGGPAAARRGQVAAACRPGWPGRQRKERASRR